MHALHACMHSWTVASLQRPFGGMLMDVVEESTNMRRNRHATTTALSSSWIGCLIAMLLQVSKKRFARGLLSNLQV